MTDRLDWLNRHLVLVEYQTLSEAEKKGGYVTPAILKYRYPNANSVEELLVSLADAGDFRECCDLLAAVMHKRVAVWWGYLCILDLLKELSEQPVKKKDIADICKPKELKIPDWAKPKEEEPVDPELLTHLQESLEQAQSQINEVIKKIPPEVLDLYHKTFEKYDRAIKEECGYTRKELLKLCIDNFDPLDSEKEDTDSPIEKATRELREQLEKKRQEIVKQIKDAFPEEPPHYKENLRSSALDAVWRWIAVPNETNSQLCLSTGNACTAEPAGLLALTAFWSFGNLTPGEERVTLTPSGLTAKGLSGVLIQCASAEGGVKSFKERYKTYFEIGFEMACGRNLWPSDLSEKEALHQKIFIKSQKTELGEGRFRTSPNEDALSKR